MDWTPELDAEYARLLQVEAFQRNRVWLDAIHATNSVHLREISELENIEALDDEGIRVLRLSLGHALLMSLMTEPAVLKLLQYRVFKLGRQLNVDEIASEILGIMELAIDGMVGKQAAKGE